MVRMIAVSAVSPGKVQHRTGTPSRVTAIAITTCGRSGRWSLECPNARVPASAGLVVSSSVRVVGQLGELVGGLGLPVGGGGVHEHDVKIKIEEVGDRGEHLGGDLVQGVEQEVHRRVGGVVGEPRAAGRSPPARPPSRSRPASTRARSARCATSANTTRSTCSPSSRRPAATRRIAAPIPRRSQIRSSVHAAPNRRESSTSTPPPSPARGRVAVTACSGVRNREIDDTSRASAARSTVSARPKLWITFATGFPLTGCRSLCASCRYDTTEPSRLVRRVSRKNTPTAQPHHRSSYAATRPKSCAYTISGSGAPAPS